LKIANPTADVQVLTLTREAAAALLVADPALADPAHRGLGVLRSRYAAGEARDFSKIS